MKRAVNDILRRANGREIVLYGCSNMAEALRRMLESANCRVSFIVDQNYNYFHNIGGPVLQPDSIFPEKHFLIIVPFGENAVRSIKNDCIKLGYRENDWFIWYKDVDYDIQFQGIKFGKRSQLSLAFTKFDTNRYIHSVGRYTSINHWLSYGMDHNLGLTTSSLVSFPSLQKTGMTPVESKLKIGNDVWIGANVFINCSKVKMIGDGAIIGAGAVVIEDVPPYSVVAGIPGKVKRYRFTSAQIEVLEKVQWWNWSDNEMNANAECFYEPKLFFERFG